MQANHQYFVKTKNGMLELSKGAYLTILKRQKDSVKTVKKTKKIHHQFENIKTLKKIYPNHQKSLKQQYPSVHQTHNIKELSFLQSKGIKPDMSGMRIFEDRRIFSMRSIPYIEMQWDNDISSDWPEIERGVENLKQSFSMAILNSLKFDVDIIGDA